MSSRPANNKMTLGFIGVISTLALASVPANAATWYVDKDATTGANTGVSWTDAWTDLGNTTYAKGTVKPGDTVYISGGPAGQSRTYHTPAVLWANDYYWTPASGTTGTGNSITYQIGQVTGHNGLVIFDCSSGSSPHLWIGGDPGHSEIVNGMAVPEAVHDLVVSGDAGDGQMHFALTNCCRAAYLNGSDNVTISYVNMGYVYTGDGSGAGAVDGVGAGSPNNQIQIDHCWCKVIDPTADHFSLFVLNGTGYGDNKAFNNTLLVPRNSGGDGADCFHWDGSGMSIHDNTVIGYVTNYTGTPTDVQHQDGFQSLGIASYIEIYNNTFRDCGNTGVFLDGINGDFYHVRICNNVIFMATQVPSAANPRGIDIISDDTSKNNPPGVPSSIGFHDVVVLNNLAANYPTEYGIGFYQPLTGASATYESCVIGNNICYNVNGGFDLASDTLNLIRFDNVSQTGYGTEFGEYTDLTSWSANFPYDFHLTPDATAFIGQAANESQYGTTFPYIVADKDGNPRPSSGAWDVGPYKLDPYAAATLSINYSCCSDCYNGVAGEEGEDTYMNAFVLGLSPAPSGPAPQGAVLELFDSAMVDPVNNPSGYVGSVPWGGATLYYLQYFEQQWEQDSVFQVRYRNGNVVGPLSNQLPDDMPWYNCM